MGLGGSRHPLRDTGVLCACSATQELRGLGLANLVGAAFNCYTTTGSFSRSAVMNDVGAKTQLAGVTSGARTGPSLSANAVCMWVPAVWAPPPLSPTVPPHLPSASNLPRPALALPCTRNSVAQQHARSNPVYAPRQSPCGANTTGFSMSLCKLPRVMRLTDGYVARAQACWS